SNSVRNHFILVHGLCHGAWCWYKVIVALEAAGHRVTAVDLAASGAHPARIDEVHSFEEYSRPLLDAVAAAPEGGSERLVLVGHSHGGLSIALTMERFPGKVATAVFVAAAMPCVGKHMGVTTEEVHQKNIIGRTTHGLRDAGNQQQPGCRRCNHNGAKLLSSQGLPTKST
uniref:AB hydrolase-1 domain-containing protein n=1 Tax=Aegilops tauschii subsp. strangulata TaxID=200361 RepID=A0A453GGL6_AEGTS